MLGICFEFAMFTYVHMGLDGLTLSVLFGDRYGPSGYQPDFQAPGLVLRGELARRPVANVLEGLSSINC